MITSGLSLFVAILLGLSLAACCGFRVFLPLLLLSLAHRFFNFHLSSSTEWLGSTPAILCLSIATLAEILGYLIPGVDHLLDVAATPVSMGAGALAATSVLGNSTSELLSSFTNPEQAHLLQTIAMVIMGGTAAGMTQLGTSLLRMGSTKTTGGLANPLFAKLETLLAFVGTLLSFWIPLIMGLVFIVFFVGMIYFIFKKFIKKTHLPPSTNAIL
jgi:hypothetical protein